MIEPYDPDRGPPLGGRSRPLKWRIAFELAGWFFVLTLPFALKVAILHSFIRGVLDAVKAGFRRVRP